MTGQRLVWVNGNLIPWENATVHILSHGLSRGSAIFEVLGFHEIDGHAKAFRLDTHLERFQKTCDLLGMELAQTKEELTRAIGETIKANGLKTGFIKMVGYWGGEAFATLVPTDKLDMSIFAISMSADVGLDLSKPITACISKWAKLHPRTVPVGAKVAAHYLNGMMARQDAQRRGFDMGIMLDTHGFVAEGSIESVFMIKDGALKTAPLGRILSSVSRRSVLAVARKIGIETLETAITPEELLDADELFTSATPFKTLSIGKLEDKTLDAPGPVTSKLHQAMDTVLKGRDDRFADWFQTLD